MIEILFEIVLSLIWEIITYWLWEPSPDKTPSGRSVMSLWVSALVLVLVGALAGGLTTIILPNRVFQTMSIPGTSLVLSPLICGLVMKAFGNWRQERGMKRSDIATFWGGALFAFAMAAVRFELVN